MSKHLPNCPHLSKYDGLGDAGMIMAINEKHRKNDSYKTREDTYFNQELEKIIEDIEKLKGYQEDMKPTNGVHNIVITKKDYENTVRKAYIDGYNQGKEDTNKGIIRNPMDLWSTYWNK